MAPSSLQLAPGCGVHPGVAASAGWPPPPPPPPQRAPRGWEPLSPPPPTHTRLPPRNIPGNKPPINPWQRTQARCLLDDLQRAVGVPLAGVGVDEGMVARGAGLQALRGGIRGWSTPRGG